MPDEIFENSRLARVYDALEGERSDLDVYAELANDDGVQSVLDVGCGTGNLALRLADQGKAVLGVDPAGASVDVARGKPGADRVTWLVGTAEDAAADPANHDHFDLATMTANVAQVFTDDDDWLATLSAIRTCLKPGARLAFETRNVTARGWEQWTKAESHQTVEVDGEGAVEDWVEVTNVEERPSGSVLVTFESPTIFQADGERLESTSILRFRTEDEIMQSLRAAGYDDVVVRGLPRAPDRAWLITATA